jgi:hypothetical protein
MDMRTVLDRLRLIPGLTTDGAPADPDAVRMPRVIGPPPRDLDLYPVLTAEHVVTVETSGGWEDDPVDVYLTCAAYRCDWTSDDIEDMTPEQVVELANAHRAGVIAAGALLAAEVEQ